MSIAKPVVIIFVIYCILSMVTIIGLSVAISMNKPKPCPENTISTSVSSTVTKSSGSSSSSGNSNNKGIFISNCGDDIMGLLKPSKYDRYSTNTYLLNGEVEHTISKIKGDNISSTIQNKYISIHEPGMYNIILFQQYKTYGPFSYKVILTDQVDKVIRSIQSNSNQDFDPVIITDFYTTSNNATIRIELSGNIKNNGDSVIYILKY